MLPFSRNTTYSTGSPIYSVDLNALQDAIIGKKHGPSSKNIPLIEVYGSGNWNPCVPGGGISNISFGGIQCLGVVGSITPVFYVPWEVGDQLLGLEVTRNSKTGAAVSCNFDLFWTNEDGTPGGHVITPLYHDTIATNTQTRLVLPVNDGTHVMQPGQILLLEMIPQNVGYGISNARLLYQRP